jgi:archaellum biogenesis ATPase FlaH
MALEKVDNETERRILIGLIVSKQYCTSIAKLIDFNIFSASFSKRIAEWAVKHYLRYKEPINTLIQDTFNRESENMSEDDVNLTKELLIHISNEYDEEELFNASYWIDKTIEYIKKKKLEQSIEQVKDALAIGRVKEAETIYLKYNSVAKETSGISSIKNKEEILEEVFSTSNNILFQPSGDIGKLMGPLRRRGLVGIFGAAKSGKTFLAFDLALQAAKKGNKVLIVSLEMSESECWGRLIQQACKRPLDEKLQEALYAVPDCAKNQNGSCRNRQRTNKVKYLTGRTGAEYINPDYTPCTLCMGNSLDFEISFFDVMHEKPVLTKEEADKLLNKQIKWNNLDNIHVVAFPQFSVGFDAVSSTLDYMEQVENILPDIVVIDYLNALRCNSYKDKRNNIDEIWMNAKRASDEKSICIISPIHSNRSGYKEDAYLGMDNVSESIGIMNTLSQAIGIDYDSNLAAHKVVRAHIVADRFSPFDSRDIVYCCQTLDHGVFCGESWYYKHLDHVNMKSGKAEKSS